MLNIVNSMWFTVYYIRQKGDRDVLPEKELETIFNIYNKIKKKTKWSNKKIAAWFVTKNPNFGGLTPRLILKLRPERAVKVINQMIKDT